MSWREVCAASDVPENGVKKFDAGGVALVIANYGADAYRALPPMCPHMEEPLAESGIIKDCVLTCTKHLWSWNLETFEKLGETEKALSSYEVKVEGGKIFARVDKELLYDFEEEGEDDDEDFFSR